MTKQLRWLLPIIVIVALAVVVLAVNPFSIFGFTRGGSDAPLGLTLGLDLEGGSHLVYDILPQEGQTITQTDAEAVRDIVSQRVNQFGASEPSVQLLGSAPDYRLLVQIPGQASNPQISVTVNNGFYNNALMAEVLTIPEIARIATSTLQRDDITVDIADIITNPNNSNSIVYTFDFEESLNPAQVDVEGNVIEFNDAEKLRQTLENIPILLNLQFSTNTVDLSLMPTPTATDTETIDMMLDGAEEDTATVDMMLDGAEEDTATVDMMLDGAEEDTATVDMMLDGAEEDTATVDMMLDGAEEDTATVDVFFELPTQNDVYQAFVQAGRADALVRLVESFTQTTDFGGEVAVYQYSARFRGLMIRGERDESGAYVQSEFEDLEDELMEFSSYNGYNLAGLVENFVSTGGIEEAKALIGSTALLEFRERECGNALVPEDGISPDVWEVQRCTDPRYYQERSTAIDPADLESAQVGVNQGQAGPVINIVFNNDGANAFFDVTSRIAGTGDRLAIYLDNEELIAPGADAPISGGRAFIQGDFTQRGDFQRAETIAIQLQSGALPASLEITQERTVDATLGSDSLNRSLIAAAIGLALLAVFLILYYKIPGVVATITLIAYTLTLVAIIKLIPITLTLSGIAAIILSLGFAVDANILTAERIKEELKSGRDIYSAISNGYRRAWSSIRDGNLSTLIVALVLYWFGDRFSTSLIQGFALTLGIGILLSMFYAYVVNRVLVRILAFSPLGRSIRLFVPVLVTATNEPALSSATSGRKAEPAPEQSEGSDDSETTDEPQEAAPEPELEQPDPDVTDTEDNSPDEEPKDS